MACKFHALAGFLALLVLATPPLWAADGRIGFSGAVVEPTCPFSTRMPPDPTTAARGMRLACETASTDLAPARLAFVQTVTRLSANERIPVLKYFSDYAAASQPRAPRPILVTQTYE